VGENNCFLNVTIQALWHLGPFRIELQKLIGRPSYGLKNGGLLQTLCNLFTQYEFAEQSVLPPTELRESLSSLSGEFQLGKIADANEVLDYILQHIHDESEEKCPEHHKCLSHAVFGGGVMEQVRDLLLVVHFIACINDDDDENETNYTSTGYLLPV
jgi:hypothetical protein